MTSYTGKLSRNSIIYQLATLAPTSVVSRGPVAVPATSAWAFPNERIERRITLRLLCDLGGAVIPLLPSEDRSSSLIASALTARRQQLNGNLSEVAVQEYAKRVSRNAALVADWALPTPLHLTKATALGLAAAAATGSVEPEPLMSSLSAVWALASRGLGHSADDAASELLSQAIKLHRDAYKIEDLLYRMTIAEHGTHRATPPLPGEEYRTGAASERA